MSQPDIDRSPFGQLADALENDWRSKARPEQVMPAGDWWTIWLYSGGRGTGKTRSGAEAVQEMVTSGRAKRIALVAPTAADVRDVMIEGESGLLAIAPDWNRPVYEPSKRRLTWPSGAMATAYSADEPERLRGPQHDMAWTDEIGAWRYLDAWDMLMMGLRLGKRPLCIATSTPKPTKLIRDLLKREGKDVAVTRGRTMDNASNLAPTFLSTIVARYAGTRLGRQELDAELLDDVQGALWNGAMIERSRCTPADVPELQRVVVAIDPAVTSHLESDATGIVVVGLGADGHGYVLADCSGKFSPTEWAKEAVRLYHLHKADRIVAEVNNGGDLVEATIRMIDQNVSYKAVHASRGKLIRAEPVSALYEQNRVHHVGLFAELEDELCTFSPGSSTSPDRLDALVWGISDLLVSGVPGYGIIEFYRREAMAAGGSAGAPRDDSADVRLAAPEGISAVYMMSGRQCCVGPDGTVLASPEDAAPLMAAGWRMR